MSRVRITILAAALGCLAMAVMPIGVTAGGSTSVVECGQLSSYTAPDPVTPADGSLGIGLLAPWVIAADATVGPNAAAALPALAGTGPSCLALELNGGVITSLDFAPSGSITGPVVEDPGIPGYILDDRLLVPTFITDAYPQLAAIFVTSEASGTLVTAMFDVDTTLGGFVGVHATAEFCGRASLDGDGNGHIGAAIIPAAVLSVQSAATIDAANGERRCATVVTQGVVGQELELSTDVTITGGPKPTPPDTAADQDPTARAGPYAWADAFAGLAVLLGAIATLAVVRVLRPRRDIA